MKKTIMRMTDNPDIGVVMPIYKQEPHYLQLALTSILNQSYRNFKLVIVLDGAPVGVKNLVTALTRQDPRVKIIDKKVNGGVSNALNTGFEYLYTIQSIKYLTWVSSDNIHYYRMLEKLRIGFTGNNNRIGLVYSSFWQIDDKGGRVYQTTTKQAFIHYQDQPKEKLLEYCFIGACFLYRKDIAQAIRGYYLEPVEDYDYWLRFTEHCEIKFIKEMLMEYRVNSPQSISSQLRNSSEQHRKWRNSLNLARYQARLRRNIPPELTVIIPLNSYSQFDIKRYERLLEQYYSNFVVMIIDNSNDGTIEQISQIPDPRVKIMKPNNTAIIHSLVMYALPQINTPYTTVFNETGDQYDNQFYLENIMQQKKFNRLTFQKGDVYITSQLNRYLGG